jgi:hypothetical protein
MYAVVRESQLRPGIEQPDQAARAEFAALRHRQPGHRGSLSIDIGGGHILTIGLWDSREAADAAAPILRPEMERLLLPELTGPPEVIHQGTVLGNDFKTSYALATSKRARPGHSQRPGLAVFADGGCSTTPFPDRLFQTHI